MGTSNHSANSTDPAKGQAFQVYFWEATVYEIIVMLWNMEIYCADLWNEIFIYTRG